MEPNDDTNLTEKLFTRVKKVLETSEVSNSSPVDEQDSALSDSFIDGALSPRWYRLLRRPTWAWQGADPVEVEQTLAQVRLAQAELDARGAVHAPVRLGAMIEVPAAALMVRYFLRHFDFLSIGTNDLIQYTLAIDRTDEAVAHLYDPMHPAVLRLVADVIAAGREQGKSVSVCGETAGDVTMTRLLLGLGLRSFSMYPRRSCRSNKRCCVPTRASWPGGRGI